MDASAPGYCLNNAEKPHVFRKPPLSWLLETHVASSCLREWWRMARNRKTHQATGPPTIEKELVNHLDKARENRFMGRKFSDRLVTLNRGFIHA